MEHNPNSTTNTTRTRVWWRTGAALCAVLCITLSALWLFFSDTSQPNLAPPPEKSQVSPTPTVAPLKPKVATEVSPPVHLRVPSIGVDTNLIGLSLNNDDTVQVPARPEDAGWFTGGTNPGQPGSAVILGHVDSTTGPAVFYRLRELEPGDRMSVTLADGSKQVFRVLKTVTYDNEDFPAQKVYAGTKKKVLLNLVTCGGEFDRDNGGYQSNVVVYTEAVGAGARAR